MPLAAHHAVAQGDRNQHEGDPGRRQRRRPRPVTPRAAFQPQPDAERRHQDQRVLARQAERAEQRADADPPPRRGRAVQGAAQEPEQSAQEEDVDHRLLQGRIDEDRRRVEGQRGAGGDAHPRREEPAAGRRQQHGRRRAQHRLADAHDGDVRPERGVDHAEQIGIERRLVEDLRAEPVAGREPPRPAVVLRRVAEQELGERRIAELPHVDEAHDQRGGEDGGQRRGPDGGARGRRRTAARRAAPAAFRARPAPPARPPPHRFSRPVVPSTRDGIVFVER